MKQITSFIELKFKELQPSDIIDILENVDRLNEVYKLLPKNVQIILDYLEFFNCYTEDELKKMLNNNQDIYLTDNVWLNPYICELYE